MYINQVLDCPHNREKLFTSSLIATLDYITPVSEYPQVLPLIKLNYHLRRRDLYDTTKVGDEFHVLLNCPALKDFRETCIPSFFYENPLLLQISIIIEWKEPIPLQIKFLHLSQNYPHFAKS